MIRYIYLVAILFAILGLVACAPSRPPVVVDTFCLTERPTYPTETQFEAMSPPERRATFQHNERGPRRVRLGADRMTLADIVTAMLPGVIPALAVGGLVWHHAVRVTNLDARVTAAEEKAAAAGAKAAAAEAALEAHREKTREQQAAITTDIHAIRLEMARDSERWRAVVERLDGMQGLLQSIASSIAARPVAAPRRRGASA